MEITLYFDRTYFMEIFYKNIFFYFIFPSFNSPKKKKQYSRLVDVLFSNMFRISVPSK